jgi:hypothetical protein
MAMQLAQPHAVDNRHHPTSNTLSNDVSEWANRWDLELVPNPSLEVQRQIALTLPLSPTNGVPAVLWAMNQADRHEIDGSNDFLKAKSLRGSGLSNHHDP